MRLFNYLGLSFHCLSLMVAVFCLLGDDPSARWACVIPPIVEIVLLGFSVRGIFELKAFEWNAVSKLFLNLGMVLVTFQLCFCFYYQLIGLQHGSDTTKDFADAIYFSIITWTTTGYGDFAPMPNDRMIAAAEAMCGTLYNGLFIGSIVYILGLPREQSPADISTE